MRTSGRQISCIQQALNFRGAAAKANAVKRRCDTFVSNVHGGQGGYAVGLLHTEPTALGAVDRALCQGAHLGGKERRGAQQDFLYCSR